MNTNSRVAFIRQAPQQFPISEVPNDAMIVISGPELALLRASASKDSTNYHLVFENNDEADEVDAKEFAAFKER